ncbi:MAG: hypothetical protein WCE62_05715, partial [Polyangiales bacterium]
MTRMIERVIAVLVLAALGCGDGGGDGGGGQAGGGGNPGGTSFSARIDGEPWAADDDLVQVTGNPGAPRLGTIVISGLEVATGQGLTLALSFISGPGTYPLGVNIGTTPGGTGQVTDPPDSWLTPLSGDAGTVTITVRTATRIAGTFSFSADPLLGGGPAAVVTDGKFDITQSAGLPALPTGDGSTASATIDGSAWNGATVVALNPGAGVLSVSASNTAYSISMTPKVPLTAGNSYGIPSQISLTIIRTGAADSWVAIGGDDVGTWTIDTFTATRATGTFDATLPKSGG